MTKYQFYWNWKPNIYFRRYNPRETSWAYIFEWVLKIGFLEIRKWSNRKLKK